MGVAALVDDEWSRGDELAVGTVTLVYDHHSSDLADKVTQHQHSHHEEIISTLHIHLDAHNCLEVVVLKGMARPGMKIRSKKVPMGGAK
mgnify:CR=1 FL=1